MKPMIIIQTKSTSLVIYLIISITNKDPYKYWNILLSKIFHKNDKSLCI